MIIFFSKPSSFLSVMAYCVSCVGETCVRFQLKMKPDILQCGRVLKMHETTSAVPSAVFEP